MKQILYVPFPYDVQILNFYLHSYFAQVQVRFNQGAHEGGKHTLKFVIEEDIMVLYYEKAQML